MRLVHDCPLNCVSTIFQNWGIVHFVAEMKTIFSFQWHYESVHRTLATTSGDGATTSDKWRFRLSQPVTREVFIWCERGINNPVWHPNVIPVFCVLNVEAYSHITASETLHFHYILNIAFTAATYCFVFLSFGYDMWSSIYISLNMNLNSNSTW